MRESKVAMIRRLREMNEQMHAIDEMSNNMESDFMNTHLVSGGAFVPLEKIFMPHFLRIVDAVKMCYSKRFLKT